MNRYHKKIQWIIAISMFLVSFFIGVIFGALMAYSLFWIWLIFLLMPISYIFVVPLFKLVGYFIYLLPMLVVSKPSEKRYKLHDGTLVDFFLMIKKHGRINLKRKILCCYLSGLLKIIRKIENKSLPKSVIVMASTYLFNSRTIGKLGFNISTAGMDEKFGFIMSYPSLLIMRSLVYGRISFPKLENIKTMKVTGMDLVKNKDIINFLYSRIKSRA